MTIEPQVQVMASGGSEPPIAPPLTATAEMPDEDGQPLPPALRWRVALVLGGIISLLGTVVLVSNPLTGLVATVAAVTALAVGLVGTGSWPFRRVTPHVLATMLAGMSMLGLCASACGTYAAYESILGMPTAAVGALLHIIIAFVVLIDDRSGRPDRWVGDLAIAVGVGASIFFAILLISGGVWCGACAGIHALMVVQGIELLVNRRGVLRAAAMASMLAAALGGNAIFHHRLVPEVRNDAADLLAYLRSQRVSDAPLQPVRQLTPSQRADELSRLNQNLSAAARVSAAVDAGVPVPASAPTRMPGPVQQSSSVPRAAAPPADVGEGTPIRAAAHPVTALAVNAQAAFRAPAMANRWGRTDAPVALMAMLDTGCPACRAEFPQLLELRDLVDHGRLQIRFLLSYRNEASQAAATIGYAAGLVGEQQMLDVLRVFYEDQPNLLTPADVLQVCPPSFPRAQALQVVKSQQLVITDLLKDAMHVRDQVGSAAEPSLWLFRRGDGPRAARQLSGFTPAESLRVAITSLLPSDDGATPSTSP